MAQFDSKKNAVMHTILFTGGGSAGHVTPNIAIIQAFQRSGWKVHYAGSKHGIENDIIKRLGVDYYSIATGKLRRYFSWRTFVEPFAVLLGIYQAVRLCWKLKPDVIFSKGGFVAFPIVFGGWLNRIPVVIHESDLTPGLANRLSFPFASKVFVSFDDSQRNVPAKKILVTGNPIRESLLQGKKERGLALCRFNDKDPVLLIVGGGLGALRINQTVRAILPQLLETFQVAHVCGKGKVDSAVPDNDRYRQFEYIDEELADLFACSDLVLSRAGSNSLYELLRLQKPHLVIPLSRRASRGDQIINANFFARLGLTKVLYEENLTPDTLLQSILKAYANKNDQQQRLASYILPESNKIIYEELVRIASGDADQLQKDSL